MNGATLDRDYLIDLALAPGTSPLVRLVLGCAERAERDGVAEWDPNELRELIGEGTEHGLSKPGLGSLLGLAIRHGHVLPGSTATRVLLDTSKVQPHGIPRAGERFGSLTLTRLPRPGQWACKCDCGAVRTFSEDHLTAGLARHCTEVGAARVG